MPYTGTVNGDVMHLDEPWSLPEGTCVTVTPVEEAGTNGRKKHPLAEFVGIWKNDPLIEEWRKAVEEYRQKKDLDELP